MEVKKILALFSLITFSLMIYINYLSGTGDINGIAAGEVSAKYPTLFTPEGFTFSIWSVIYLFGLFFLLRVLRDSLNSVNGQDVKMLMGYYILSCLLNVGWIYTWHYEMLGMSVILMMGLLITLILLYRKVTGETYKSVWRYLSTWTPISLYLSWICIAMVANISVWLSSLGWDGSPLSPVFWASFMILAAAGINLFILIRNRDIFFGLVYLWAAYGIIMARSDEISSAVGWVSGAAMSGMILVFLGILYARFIRFEKVS